MEEKKAIHLEHNPFDVRIYSINEKGPTLAWAGVNINGIFVVRDIRIMKGRNGAFVSVPQKEVKGRYRAICFPCTKAAKKTFEAAVLHAYELALQAEQNAQNPIQSQNEN